MATQDPLLQVGALFSSLCTYLLCWRRKERRRLARKVEEMAGQGWLRLKCVDSRQKRRFWPVLLEAMQSLWIEKRPGFDLNTQSTWPSGAAKDTMLTTKVAGAPRLATDNYELQAITCALFDPEIRRFHFGKKSHWMLRLLVDVWWVFCPWWEGPSGGEVSCALHGCDEAWHIVNWPQHKDDTSWKRRDHIDGGQNNIYLRKGVPCSMEDMGRLGSAADRLLHMAMWQTLILFYCDTPGDLTAKRGATAFHPLSHVIVLEAMSKLAEAGHSSMNLLQGMGDWGQRKAHLKSKVQLEIPEAEGILAMGTMVHAAAPAREPMVGDFPRVIQNCKIHASFDYFPFKKRPDLQSLFVSLIPATSMLARMSRAPLATYLDLTSTSGAANEEYIRREAQELYELLLQDPPQYPM